MRYFCFLYFPNQTSIDCNDNQAPVINEVVGIVLSPHPSYKLFLITTTVQIKNRTNIPLEVRNESAGIIITTNRQTLINYHKFVINHHLSISNYQPSIIYHEIIINQLTN